MSNPIAQANRVTGFHPSVVAYLYEEFLEDGQDNEDFLEYLADQVGIAAFIIAASAGMAIEGCLEAYAQGGESVLDPDFDPEVAADMVAIASEE